MSASRILLIRLSALGDVIHALPALAALRRAQPSAFIGWLVEDRCAGLLEGHPMLNALHVIPRKAWRENPMTALTGPMRELVETIRAERYDIAVDFQGLSKSAAWTMVCGAERRIGFRGEDAREVSRFFYNEAVFPRADQFHVIQRNLSLLRSLGVDGERVEFPLALPEAALRRAAEIWGENNARPRIVLNPGAGWKTKMWPAAMFGRLARDLVHRAGARVAVAWGPGEEPLVHEVLAAASSPASVDGVGGIGPGPGVYRLPATTFVELGGVIGASNLFVGGDTGPTHLAAALGVPIVSMFGASDAKRNGPWGERVEILQLDSPSCIPCWQTRCDWREPLACLTHVEPDPVLDACLKLLR